MCYEKDVKIVHSFLDDVFNLYNKYVEAAVHTDYDFWMITLLTHGVKEVIFRNTLELSRNSRKVYYLFEFQIL